MTAERESSSRKVIIALLLSILVLGSTSAIIFYAATNSQQPNSEASSTITSLESTIISLENTNLQLKGQLSALSTNSSSQSVPSGLSAQQVYSNSSRSVVTVQGDQLTTMNTLFGPQSTVTAVLGSGFTVDYQNSNYIITNYHVVAGDSNLTVTFPDGNAYPAAVVGSDPYSDLAVLTVAGAPASELSPLRIVPSSNLTVGQEVFAIGNPYGLSGSMTFGIVSQLGRTIQDPVAGNFSVAGAIQFSAPINPGNSGGPLLDTKGEVIGITTATVTSSQGIGFAIPSNAILRDLSSLISKGTYPAYSYLGISTVDMNYQLAQASHTNVTYGVLIESVAPRGPADKAGLRAGTASVVVGGLKYLIGGDIIVSMNGTRIVNQDALSSYLALDTAAGQTVNLGVIRSGSMITISLALGARPPA